MHELTVKVLDDSGQIQIHQTKATDQAFMEIYLSGQYFGKVISMEWTHKGQTNKLIFGD